MKKSVMVEVVLSMEGKEILTLLASGKTVHEIAKIKNVTNRAIEGQVYRLRLRYGCANTTNLIAFLLREGIIK